MKYIKKFSTHQEYEVFTATTAFVKPNVSICTTEGDVHYNPLECEETTVYEIIGEPSYPSTIEGDVTSFDMTFNYKRTDINEKCKETITEGSDTVTVEVGTNPSTASSRTVEGTYDYHGLEIAYSVTQTKFEAKVAAKFNVTDTSGPTRIASATTNFSSIEIDGVEQPSVVSAYTFNTTGEHTIKYALKNTAIIGTSAFTNCSNLTSIDIPDGVTSIGNSAFTRCYSLTRCTIGSGVTGIGSGAFRECSTLKSIVSNAMTAPTIQSNTFQGVMALGTINVPSGSNGYDVWMGTGDYYLGKYSWTKVEQ